jgi:O-antigen ligase/polysaccharide polymerase Wzy-like membrane protein
VVPAIVCGALAVAYRPWSYGGDAIPDLDRLLALIVALMAFQLLPLPRVVIDVLSPADRRVWERLSLSVPSSLPISIDLNRTGAALLVTAGAFTVFLVARRIFESGGVRIAVRGVSIIGMLVSAIALAQDATAHGLMYWRWKPLDEGPAPFGPFVNRNHFGTWAVIAVPMCLGYLAAHTAAHRHHTADHAPFRRRIVTFFDGRAIGLTTSAVLMLVGIGVSLSRSALAGIATAAIVSWLLGRGRGRGESSNRAMWWIAGGAVAVVMLTVAEVGAGVLGVRLSTAGISAGNRLLIWRDTIPIIRDFWLTGTGAGTYLTSMLLYQRSSQGWLYNQAHNHYLQVLSEGGLMIAIPVFGALALYARDAWRRLFADQSGMFWIRAGAFCGLAGLAVQSLWETGLTMPANAALAAIAAAIVVHDAASHART